MAQIGTIQIAGNANAGPAEVELNTHAARFVVRPHDFTLWGSYRAAGSVLAANASTSSTNLNLSTPGFKACGLAHNPDAVSNTNNIGSRSALVALRRVTMGLGYFGDVNGKIRYSFGLARSLGTLRFGGSDVALFGSPQRANMPAATAWVIKAVDGGAAANSAGLSSTTTTYEANLFAKISVHPIEPNLPLVVFEASASQLPLLLDRGQAAVAIVTGDAGWTAAATLRISFTFEWDEYRLVDF